MKKTGFFLIIAGMMLAIIALFSFFSDSNLKSFLTFSASFIGAAMVLLGFSFLLMRIEFRKKRTILRVSSITGVILLLSGIIAEDNSTEESTVMLLGGSFILAFISAPLLFKLRYDKWRHYARTRTDTFLLTFLDSISLIILVIGLLFKYLHWPYGNVMVMTAIMVLIINALVWNMRFRKEVIFRKETEDKLVQTLQEVAHQKSIVEQKNNEILESIRYARHIQDGILPPVNMVKNLLGECFVLYKPKDIVAGDFYWMEPKNGKIYLAVADCTGHGVPGAMVSVMCSNALSKVVKDTSIEEPGKLLDLTVEILEEQFSQSEKEIKDGMDLALICLDTKNRILYFAGANNPLYYIRDRKLSEIKGDNQPVGRFEGMQNFSTYTLPLQKGDCIYIFTDGYADQFGGPKGKKFKYKTLKELLISNCEKPMAEQRDELEKVIDNWKGDLEQVDDICMIGLRIS